MYKGTPSPFAAEAMEDARVLVSGRPASEIFTSSGSAWLPFLMAMMQERMSVKDRRIEGFILGDAERPYLDFLGDYPDIPSRVPQHCMGLPSGNNAGNPEPYQEKNRRTVPRFGMPESYSLLNKGVIPYLSRSSFIISSDGRGAFSLAAFSTLARR